MTPFEDRVRKAILLFVLAGIPLIGMAEPPNADRTSPANEELRAVVARAYEHAWAEYKIGGLRNVEDVYCWSRRWMQAERATSTTRGQDIHAVRSHLQRLQELSKMSNRLAEWWQIDYYLTETEVLLASVDAKEKQSYERIRLERARLQGTWKVQSATDFGKSVALDLDTITVHGRIVIETGQTGGSAGILSIDPTPSPKTFNYGGVNEDYNFKRAGSYRLTDDVWTMNLGAGRVVTLIRAQKNPGKARD